MAVLQAVESPETALPDPLVVRVDALLAEFAAAAEDDHPVDAAVRIDRIAGLERLRAATAGLQMAESVRFAQAQVAAQLEADVHPARIGQGIADQLGLACGLSPVTGARRLNVARALWFELPASYSAVVAGELSERVAEVIVTETRHLDPQTRRRVDHDLHAAGITAMGYREAAACARKHAYQADPHGYAERGRTERNNRRVGIRPAPDTMAVLSGFLPVEQGVACYAALRRHTDSQVAGGDERTRDQIMADTFVERLTGQTAAADVNVEVQITIPLDALFDPEPDPHQHDEDEVGDAEPEPEQAGGSTDQPMPGPTDGPTWERRRARTAQLGGYGPLPLGLARDILDHSAGRKWWRRLFTSPTGHLAGGDPTRRRFDGWLAKLIGLRDQTCRDPFCDAPIRHIDHIHRWADGGPTTLANGRGTCARGNLIRELHGWQVTLIHAGQLTEAHTIQVTTPTGHTYHSRAPDPP